MSNNKFAAALKPAKQPAAPEQPATAERTASHVRPSRTATKLIGGHFDRTVSRQLKEIAVAEDTTVQALVAEALDMLFHSRQKPTIASKPKA